VEKLIEIRNISAGYDNNVVLEDGTMDIYAGDFIGVIGPNGGGKTTLLKTVLGLIKPLSGEIIYHIGRDRIGYLPQVNQVDKRFPISVIDVVRSGKAKAKRHFFTPNHADIAKAEKLLDEAGIPELRDKAIGELSGGQMQRVFLCRALMSDPQLLILDEPETFVDNKFEGELYAMLRQLNKRMAILLVSHDLGTIAYYVKTIACVNRNLHYHPSNIISAEQLAAYNCPLQIITHGDIPHTVLKVHNHEHTHDKHGHTH
jgi:zinc transport system ATP-binding protein